MSEIDHRILQLRNALDVYDAKPSRQSFCHIEFCMTELKAALEKQRGNYE